MEFTKPQSCASCHKIYAKYEEPHFRLDGNGVLWVLCACGHRIPVPLSQVLMAADQAKVVLRGAGLSETSG